MFCVFCCFLSIKNITTPEDKLPNHVAHALDATDVRLFQAGLDLNSVFLFFVLFFGVLVVLVVVLVLLGVVLVIIEVVASHHCYYD